MFQPGASDLLDVVESELHVSGPREWCEGRIAVSFVQMWCDKFVTPVGVLSRALMPHEF